MRVRIWHHKFPDYTERLYMMARVCHLLGDARWDEHGALVSLALVPINKG